MTDRLFYKLWTDALNQPSEEMYVSEYGFPEWFDEIAPDPFTVIGKLRQIHSAAHMSMKEIMDKAGLTPYSFGEKFCVNLRTVQHWYAGDRKCPDYFRLAVCRQLGLLEV